MNSQIAVVVLVVRPFAAHDRGKLAELSLVTVRLDAEADLVPSRRVTACGLAERQHKLQLLAVKAFDRTEVYRPVRPIHPKPPAEDAARHLAGRADEDGTNGTIDLCPIERFDGEELKLSMTLREAAGGYAAGRHEIGFGVQTDRYEGQLRELAAVVRGERPNDQDYDRDLRVHDLTLRMIRN